MNFNGMCSRRERVQQEAVSERRPVCRPDQRLHVQLCGQLEGKDLPLA